MSATTNSPRLGLLRPLVPLLVAGCQVAGSQPRAFAPQAPVPPPTEPQWMGAEPDEPENPPAPVVEGPRADRRSPLGVTLGPIGVGTDHVAFTDRFRQASRWRALDRRGRPHPEPLALDEKGWVRRLARGQVAVADAPTEPGASYVLRYLGDGRVEVGGARVGRRSAGRIELVAGGATVSIRIERSSPSMPIRSVELLPERWSEGPVPSFDPDFVERLTPFSVLRTAGWLPADAPSDWAHRAKPDDATQTGPGGVAYEHHFALASHLRADLWLRIPARLDDDHLQRLAGLAAKMLEPGLRLYLEVDSERSEPASEDRLLREGAVLDPDPQVGRWLASTRRARSSFSAFRRALGADRVVRVLSVPLGDSALVRRMMEFEATGAAVDALAVNPRLGADLPPGTADAAVSFLENTAVPTLLRQVQEVAAIASDAGIDLVAASGGLGLEPADAAGRDQPKRSRPASLARALEVALDARLSVPLLAMLDGWRAAGGRLFVVEPLFGPGRALPGLGADPATAPQFVAYRRFSTNAPRWWQETPLRPPAIEPGSEPGSQAMPEGAPPHVRMVPSAALEPSAEAPAVERLHTAPWAKFASFGAAAVFAGLAVERFSAAQRFENRREDALRALGATTEPDRFDALQGRVRAQEDNRGFAQSLGFAAVGVAVSLVGWAVAQWLDEPQLPPISSWSEDPR